MNKKQLFEELENLIKNEICNEKYNILKKNACDLEGYWNVGRILAKERQEQPSAEWDNIIKSYSERLMSDYGEFYSTKNLLLFYEFYITYPSIYELSANISWSHYKQLIRLESDSERRFYGNLIMSNDLSVTQLKKLIKSYYYYEVKALFEQENSEHNNFLPIAYSLE